MVIATILGSLAAGGGGGGGYRGQTMEYKEPLQGWGHPLYTPPESTTVAVLPSWGVRYEANIVCCMVVKVREGMIFLLCRCVFEFIVMFTLFHAA